MLQHSQPCLLVIGSWSDLVHRSMSAPNDV